MLGNGQPIRLIDYLVAMVSHWVFNYIIGKQEAGSKTQEAVKVHVTYLSHGALQISV